MLSDYDRKQLENADGNFNDCLSLFEKMLCRLFYRMEIIGKKGKTVPVLFPSQVKLQMDLLIKKGILLEIQIIHTYFQEKILSFILEVQTVSESFLKNVELRHQKGFAQHGFANR